VVDAAAERPRTVAFRFRAKDPNPLMVQHWLTLNAILPQHVWEPLLAAAKGDFNKLIKHKANTFTPRIWLKARKGVRAWFDEPHYFPPACMSTAFINHLRAAREGEV
jgi:hypothetical protein